MSFPLRTGLGARQGFLAACGLCLIVAVADWHFLAGRTGPIQYPFATTKIDVGRVLRGKRLELTFPYSPGFDPAKTPMSLVCSCGCMRRDNRETPESSGNRGLSLTLLVPRSLGPFHKQCNYRMAGGAETPLEVVGEAIGPVAFEPPELLFGAGGDRSEAAQLKVRRAALSRQQFRAIRFRVASGALKLAERTRSADEIVATVTVTAADPTEIERGIYVEMNGAEPDSGVSDSSVEHVACRWTGPRLIPSVAVFPAGKSVTSHEGTFSFQSSDPRVVLKSAEFSGPSHPTGIRLRIIADAAGQPALEIQTDRNVDFHSGTYPISVHYGKRGSAADSGTLQLLLRFI